VVATAEFTPEERNLLVRLPRWLVGAASAAHADGAARTRQEIENGFLSVAAGRQLGNRLIAELADACMKIFDQDPKLSGIDPYTPAGRDLILQYATMAVDILRAKAEPLDATMYRRWLLSITDDVITHVRTFGGAQIHPDDRAFRQRISEVTRGNPEA
jgi:hypothetical protein